MYSSGTRTVGFLVGAACIAMTGTLDRSLQSQSRTGDATHWERYKDRDDPPSEDLGLTDPVLNGAIDLHAHHGPDAYPRQLDAFQVAELARDRGMRGILLKNHWTETAGLAYLVTEHGPGGIEVFGSITLDTPVGGINPQAIRYMVDVNGGRGRIVWLPTHDSEHEIEFNNEDRISVAVSRDGILLEETLEVISLIAQHGLTLATGHVTPEEALMIIREARDRGVDKIIVTHPLLDPQFTYMSIEEMQEAASLGAYIEITARTLWQGGEPMVRALEAIRALGPEHCFISSDAGLTWLPNHTDSLVLAARTLREAGFSEEDLNRMFKENPARLVGLPVL